MKQCKAKTIKSGGKKRCNMLALPGEEVCFFHSTTEKGSAWRKRRKRARKFDREDLLKELVKDYRFVDDVKGNDLSKLRLRAQLSAQIQEVLKDLHRIDELEKLVDEHVSK